MANGIKPHEIIQLCSHLDDRFGGVIEGSGKGEEAKKRNFYTKAIAAYYLTQVAGATDSDAISASIDGGGDHGIDSVYIDNTQTIWLLQSKYKDSGEGEVELAEVGKFIDGVADLLNQKYDRFNEALNTKVTSLNSTLSSGVAKVRAVLVYTGNALSDDRRRMMQDLESAFNQPADPSFLQCSKAGLGTFHKLVVDELSPGPINAEIVLENYGHVTEPFICYFGSLSGEQLKLLKDEYGDQLFDSNIRHFQGSTIVNQDIAQTIQDNPDHFFYFNNGVTFICDTLRPVGARDETRSIGKFKVDNLSVINGAQTVSSISQSLALTENQPASLKVLASFIALDSIQEPEIDSKEFGQAVTRYRNNQNSVSDIDFASLDENQVQWAQTLQQSGVNYRYKSGDLDQEDFNVEIAAKALTCWISGNDWCQLVAQAKKDGKKLFARVAGEGVESPTYNRLFKDTLQARQIWRIVQIVEIVKSSIRHEVSQTIISSDDTINPKEVLKNSIYLTAHIVFIKFPYVDHAELSISINHGNQIRGWVQRISQVMISEFRRQRFDKSPKAVYQNATDLDTLKGPMMAILAST